MSVIYGGKACLDPRRIWEQCRVLGIPTDLWFGTANRYVCEYGVQPGLGFLLMARGDLDLLDRESPHDLIFADAFRTVTLKDLTFVNARCVVPGARGDPAGVYLVQVADVRLLLDRVPIDKAYSVRSSPGSSTFEANTLDGGARWSWSGMVQDIWQTVPGLGAYPGLPFSPDGQPEGFVFYGAYAMQALGFVLDRLRCALKYNPFTKLFTIVRVGASDAAELLSEAKWDRDFRVWDEDWLESNVGRLPQYVRVLFHRQPAPADGSSVYYSVDVADTTPDPGTEAGTYVLVRDDEAALGATGVPSNSAALATRAAERAADWFRVRKSGEARLLRVYQGAVNDPGLLPGSLVRGWEVEDRGPGVRVSIIRAPRPIDQDWGQPLPEPAQLGCPSAFRFVVETEHCVLGVSKIYQSTVTLTIDAGGCLSGSATAPVYNRDEGCCACPRHGRRRHLRGLRNGPALQLPGTAGGVGAARLRKDRCRRPAHVLPRRLVLRPLRRLLRLPGVRLGERLGLGLGNLYAGRLRPVHRPALALVYPGLLLYGRMRGVQPGLVFAIERLVLLDGFPHGGGHHGHGGPASHGRRLRPHFQLRPGRQPGECHLHGTGTLGERLLRGRRFHA
jgi:hypothetical protein